MDISHVVQDFRRRYEGSYVFVEDEKKEKSLFLLESVTPHEEYNAILSLTSPRQGRLIINMASSHSLKFPETPVGVFQHGRDAYLCRRRPRRQWRRGICPDNTEINLVFRTVYSQGTSFNWQIVNSAFEQKFFSFKKALEKLNKKTVRSAALADNFALSLSVTPKDDGLILYYMDIPVAILTSDGKPKTILEKVFSNEIQRVVESI